MTGNDTDGGAHDAPLSGEPAAGGDGPARLLQWLERLPKIAIFLAVLVITLGFVWIPGPIGAVLTLVLAGAAGFLLYATWQRNAAPAARVARVCVVLALAALGIGKFLV